VIVSPCALVLEALSAFVWQPNKPVVFPPFAGVLLWLGELSDKLAEAC